MAEVFVSIHIEPLEEGGYLATSADIQGLVAQGRTLAQTMEIAQDVARKIIESCIEHGDPCRQRLRTPSQSHYPRGRIDGQGVSRRGVVHPL